MKYILSTAQFVLFRFSSSTKRTNLTVQIKDNIAILKSSKCHLLYSPRYMMFEMAMMVGAVCGRLIQSESLCNLRGGSSPICTLHFAPYIIATQQFAKKTQKHLGGVRMVRVEFFFSGLERGLINKHMLEL